jgi:PilZ domain
MSSIDATFAHLRASPRHRVLKAAKIIFDDWSAVDCQVRDISETGAQLRVFGASKLPHRFKLLMVADNMIRPVQIAWKLEDVLGVAFLGPAEKAPMRRYVPPNF